MPLLLDCCDSLNTVRLTQKAFGFWAVFVADSLCSFTVTNKLFVTRKDDYILAYWHSYVRTRADRSLTTMDVHDLMDMMDPMSAW